MNEFYVLGNDKTGKHPFGMIADFRIYAKALTEVEVEMLGKMPVFGLREEAPHGMIFFMLGKNARFWIEGGGSTR
jgi:hypothetical protein